RPFTLVDTGGIGLLRGEKVNDSIVTAAIEQVNLAIEAASVIILVVNVQEGVVPLDREVAARLRTSGKPVLVAVNKVEPEPDEPQVTEFTELGFERIFPVTAIHGAGVEALVETAVGQLPVSSSEFRVPRDEFAATNSELGTRNSEPLKLAIVGRPNVGKSS